MGSRRHSAGLPIEAPGPDDVVPVRSAASVRRFDDAADVVVLGCGCAGAAAALGAAEVGAEVLVLERAGGPGGSASLSGGWIYLGGGTPVQRACHVEDSPEEMARFLLAALGPGADEPKVDEYAAGSVGHFEWLHGLGVPFGDSLVDTRRRSPAPGDGLAWMGEDSAPFTHAARPAPRGHRPGGPGMQGPVLMDRLARAALAVSRVVTDARATALVVGSDGAVVGVAARRFGEEFAVRCRGVVVATGGFAADRSMVARHVAGLAGHSRIGTDGDDGLGIRLAAGAGAGLRGMGTGQVSLGVAPALLAVSAVVDGKGRRFINEDTYPGRVGQAALFAHGAIAYCVFDEATFEAVPESERTGQAPAVVADSAEELAAELGLEPAALAATLAEYSASARTGRDPAFGKDGRWLRG
ncbi:MAG TPA: FAD-dependent oxidoreductase, partial [Acidimicrobiales bacterium]|nr:FAD-dependent oxidoreductase [Acidimicrobiales bacterium]